MGKEIQIPQGVYKIGRDFYEGIYLIKCMNDFSQISHYYKDEYGDDADDYYSLGGDNSMDLRLDLKNGDKLEISGNVTIQKILNPEILFD